MAIIASLHPGTLLDQVQAEARPAIEIAEVHLLGDLRAGLEIFPGCLPGLLRYGDTGQRPAFRSFMADAPYHGRTGVEILYRHILVDVGKAFAPAQPPGNELSRNTGDLRQHAV